MKHTLWVDSSFKPPPCRCLAEQLILWLVVVQLPETCYSFVPSAVLLVDSSRYKEAAPGKIPVEHLLWEHEFYEVSSFWLFPFWQNVKYVQCLGVTVDLLLTLLRVLHAFRGHPHAAVMPVDLAMYLSLSRRQPLHPLVPLPPLKPVQRYSHPADCPPKTGLHSHHHSSSSSSSSSPAQPSSSSEPRSCFRRDSGGGNKKRRVVFADARGLALTAVRLFIPEPSAAVAPALLMKPALAKLQGQESASSKLERYRFRPGFPQPTQDFKNFPRTTEGDARAAGELQHHRSLAERERVRVTRRQREGRAREGDLWLLEEPSRHPVHVPAAAALWRRGHERLYFWLEPTPEHRSEGENRVLRVLPARSWHRGPLGRQQGAELSAVRGERCTEHKPGGGG